jgi:hypothetical protein
MCTRTGEHGRRSNGVSRFGAPWELRPQLVGNFRSTSFNDMAEDGDGRWEINALWEHQLNSRRENYI